MRNKLKAILVGVMVCMLLSVPAQAGVFPDIEDGAEYAEAAEYLHEIGVMQGDTSGNFNPDRYVTRAQMAAVICRMLGESEELPDSGTSFSDVPASYWASGYIAKAAELGIINGYKDGTFKPGNTVTYEQALAMVVRATGLEDAAKAAGGYPNGHIEVACECGYTNWLAAEKGDLMARWQIAVMLHNICT